MASLRCKQTIEDHRHSYGTLPSPNSLSRAEDIASKNQPYPEETEPPESHTSGSSWVGASFNLTSAIVGAGCIGLGGAISESGGLVSIFAIVLFAVLSKYSFDLLVSLAIEAGGDGAVDYESLGYTTYGSAGKLTVAFSKGLYSFGSMVAYIVIINDNFSFAVSHLLFGEEETDSTLVGSDLFRSLVGSPTYTTILLCSTVMLPLCLLRDLAPLASFSALKIVALFSIVFIVVYLFFLEMGGRRHHMNSDIIDHWFLVRGGVFESLGTFVFTFVAQHAIHLVYQSLRDDSRNMCSFQKTTSLATAIATTISLTMGLSVYMTFWRETSSDMFYLYPPSALLDWCRTLLCVSMLLTYPFPFLALRELIVLTVNDHLKARRCAAAEGTQPLYHFKTQDTPSAYLLPGNEKQLNRPYHISLTVLIWLLSLVLALTASSLGAVLNLTGCATGTVISYILPAMFSFKIRGHTFLGSFLFVVGGTVGVIGTAYSLLATIPME